MAADAKRVEAVAITAASIGHALGEDVWGAAPVVSDFVQREPREGGEPSQSTEFRVAYDSSTLYVKVRAFDREPDKIKSYLTRRDDDTPSDWIRVFVDSYHDRRTAYEFAVNPSGVKQDRYWFNDSNNDTSWDAVWDVSVSRDQRGWTAEFRIPFSQLRFTPSQTSTWGFAVSREIGRLRETNTWPLLSRNANGYVSSFGELGGLSTSAAVKKIELVPYTVANLDRQRTGGNPLLKSTGLGASAGLDVKYAVTPGLTLTGTVNPDFGQVEADPAVVNLSAFETFFNERRPFFVEGSGNFRFDADCYDGCTNLFYSRRIGRAPQGTGTLPSGDDVYSDTPSQSTILGAAKLTGRVGKYSIGVMHAVTQEEFSDVSAAGIRSERVVEPGSSYSVARVKREFAKQSYIGLITTATNRRLSDSLSFLPSSAYVGGADFDWRVKRFYSLNGYVEGSRVNGAPAAIDALQQNSRHQFQRPDLTSAQLDPTRTSLSGYAGAIAFNKIGGEFVHSNSYVYFRSPGFDTNDLGFLRRADQIRQQHWLQLRTNKVNKWFRQRNINFNQWTAWNFDGNMQFSGLNVNGNLTFVNNWTAGGGTYQPLAYHGLDDRMTRGGPAIVTEQSPEVWFYLYSDGRRKFSAGIEGDWGSDKHNSSWQSWYSQITVRPVPAIMFSLGVQYNPSHQDSQWVSNVAAGASTHYVFAHIDQTTVNPTARFNYTITPNLSVQLYAQPFLSAGSYTNFKEVADPSSEGYENRYKPFDYAQPVNGNPDFNVKSFRTTNVLRWEYKPGSTLFLVWQQARASYAVPGGFDFGRDLHGIFGAPPHNVFLVKFAYWLNY